MKRITWTTSRYGTLRGTVGAVTPELFTIEPSTRRSDSRVGLRSYLPDGGGQFRRFERFDTDAAAQEAAETRLIEYIRALGAEFLPRVVINGDAGDPEECGLDATCQDCGDGETAMSEEYAERWAKTHRCGVDV